MLPSLVFLALLGATPTLSDVSSVWDEQRLTVSVTTKGPLDVAQARGKVSGHVLSLVLPGVTLDAEESVFGLEPRPAHAYRRDDGVKLTVPFGSRLDCKGPVQLEAAPDGLRASIGCGLRPTPGTSSARVLREALALEPEAAAPSAVPETRGPPSLPGAPVLPAPRTASGALGLETSSPPATFANPAGALGGDDRSHASASLAWPAIVLAGLGTLAYGIMRKRGRATRIVHILETASLGPKRTLVVARVGGQTLLLGTSDAGVALLTALPESPEVQAAEDRAAAGVVAPSATLPDRGQNQAKLLSRLFGRKAAPGTAHFDDVLADSVEDQELRRKLEAGFAGRVA